MANNAMIKVAFLIITTFAILFVGTSDFKEEQKMQAVYIDNVCNKVWPDYKELNPSCE